jgi:hypothetical protein
MSLYSQSIPTLADIKDSKNDKKSLPKWLLSENRSPPYWLLSDDLPPWFFAEGPPKWLSEKGFRPPAWMLQDEIPRIIITSYGSEGPPLWLLNMDKLPDWFNEVDILPNWILAFKEVSPPIWALNDSISEWLKRGDIPEWVNNEDEVAKVDRWLHTANEKYPKWIVEGTYPSWMENIPNRLKKVESNPELRFAKQVIARDEELVRFQVVLIDGIKFYTMDEMKGEICTVLGENNIGDIVGRFKQGIPEFNYDSKYYYLQKNHHAAGANGFDKVELETTIIDGVKFLTTNRINGEIYSVIGENGVGDLVGRFKLGRAEFDYDSKYFYLKNDYYDV